MARRMKRTLLTLIGAVSLTLTTGRSGDWRYSQLPDATDSDRFFEERERQRELDEIRREIDEIKREREDAAWREKMGLSPKL